MVVGKETRFYYNQEIISLIKENCLGFFRDNTEECEESEITYNK